MTDTQPSPRSIPAAELAETLSTTETLLVVFQTNGCSICASMEPVVSNVARETGVETVFVNPRDPPGLVTDYEIRSVPTLAVFRDGREVGRLAEGFVPGEELTAFVREHAPS
ncbi:thioredoxin family protein [Halobaculum sp. MBLA0143]|uniref:thioredoxin family protein n=1 Tax=Halobaculum sp. MBLA0143 TaxID=3079933 RepID=UPI003524E56F